MIFNATVSFKDRARVVQLDETCTKVDWQLLKETCDAVLVTMGGMDRLDGDKRVTYHDKMFAVHIQGAYEVGLPVIAVWNAHADYYLRNMYNLKVVQEYTAQTDPMVKMIVDAWKIGAWDYATITDQQAFRRIHGIMVCAYDTVAYNGAINGTWQEAASMTLLRNLHSMIEQTKLPNVMLGFYTTPSVLTASAMTSGENPLDTALYNARAYLYLTLGQWVPPVGSAQLTELADLFDAKLPLETFAFKYQLYGYEQRTILHGFTGNFYYHDSIATATEPARLRAFLANDNVERFYAALKYTGTAPEPPPPPPPPPGEVTLKDVYALLQQVDAKLDKVSKHFAE